MTATAWFDRFPKPAIIAHRGASMDAPENTLAAFRLAVTQGADAIELDVDLCAGDELVVLHDATVDRTTDGSGKVADLPLDAIKELDAGSWFDAEYSGERVPTLDEVFETIGRQVFINVELKNYTHLFDNLAEKVALSVKRHNLVERVFFSSFNPVNFRKIKRQLPDSPVGLLTFKGMAGAWFVGPLKWVAPYDALHPHYSDVSPHFIERKHTNGMPLFAYTINEEEEMRRLLTAGLDGLITDCPARGRQIRASLTGA